MNITTTKERNKMQPIQEQILQNRVFKLITNEIVMGEVHLVETTRGDEIIIKKPFTVINGNLTPYMLKELMNAPGAIQIHPMNVIWNVEISEFPEVQNAYIKATTNLILS